ncbi:hypothetical protein [Methanobrevibacter sp.]|uniref:hypothetical protein n=1 Tax=Methanobrevibacter sp. TaxID=66852 RepID=UPI00388E42CA
MMNDNTFKESKEKFGLEEYLLEDIKYMKEQMEENLAAANNTIEEQNNELEKANGKIADLEAEIQILKEKANGK